MPSVVKLVGNATHDVVQLFENYLKIWFSLSTYKQPSSLDTEQEREFNFTPGLWKWVLKSLDFWVYKNLDL